MVIYHIKGGIVLLSNNSEKILKALYKKEKDFEKLPNSKKNWNTSKTTYSEIRELLPNSSHISTAMIVKYLLEEKYIYNHISGKENTFNVQDLEKDDLKLVIGEKGISYLEQKKYVLIAKILPISISIVSLFVSIYTNFSS
uniref:hypothetical protein n=2 Tax=Staphylococcus TaxID=1279 RepID=UPI0015EF162B|nr:hypothetical protein [Staphylococcus saprophyticus]